MPKFRTPIFVLTLLVLAAPLTAQDMGRRTGTREQMWPAATAEQWKNPVLITFQRTWEDALAVARETKKAILICINMDGEVASEHYAGIRYRQPEIAKLYEPYVCVIASTYRHNPRDYDEKGQRILCPRFGSVTCGEHIWIEPILYEKYMEGERVAPRHIMIELDGKETYDVYYANDTASVFDSIRDGITKRETKPITVVRGDRSIVERVASRDIQDRLAVEAAYRKGDKAQRKSLLEAAAKQGGDVPLDLVRMGVFGLDVEQARLARAALARSASPDATNLISDALRVPMDRAEREALIAALARLGKGSEKAKWLASVHRGLGGRSSAINPREWANARAQYEASAAERNLDDLEAQQQALSKAFREEQDDPAACVDLAEASFALAMKARRDYSGDPRIAGRLARHMFADARRAALRAGELGAAAWRVDSVLALVAYYRGDAGTAYEIATRAVETIPPGEPSWNTMAVLTVFAEGRWSAIKEAAKQRKRWPSRWLTDLDAAYSALLHHPHSTESQLLWHHDLMVWLGANERATRVLQACLARFPDSPVLHERLRKHVVKDRGVNELEAVYGEMLRGKPDSASLKWFAGYASIVAAESHRRRGRRERAVEAYGRAIEHYERAARANPKWAESASHHISLSLAGMARIAFELEDDVKSMESIVGSFERSPGSAGTKDGLGITPASTAQMLISRLTEQGRDDMVKKIVDALGKLDPALLVPEEK